MRKYIIPEDGKFRKANLHCHSTVSDGELSPEELKSLYKENGYSVLAVTDHSRFVCHNDLSDGDFLFLNGVENGVDEEGAPERCGKVCDLCFIALDSNRTAHPLQTAVPRGDLGYSAENYVYSDADINRMIALGRENGFFVTYNHPAWSLENYDRYMKYHGMDAIELYNYSSAVDGYCEYNARVYDDKLKAGERIFAVSTDDNHNRAPGTCHWDSFGGYVMIKSPSLSYSDIVSSLKNGYFYSVRENVPANGSAPVIRALWIDTDDSSVHIECENTVKIVCTRASRRQRCINAAESGAEYIGEAKISVNPGDTYLRITLYDKYGNTADTNAYFVDELGLEFNENTFVE